MVVIMAQISIVAETIAAMVAAAFTLAITPCTPVLQNWHGPSGPSAAPPVERACKLACSTAAWRMWGVIDDVKFN